MDNIWQCDVCGRSFVESGDGFHSKDNINIKVSMGKYKSSYSNQLQNVCYTCRASMGCFWLKPVPISKVIIHSSRQYGQPGLEKPKELRGIKRAFSVDWIYKKCRCQCFILDNDIYIKHRDFGSIPLYGLTLDEKEKITGRRVSKKFIWNDNWGCVVLRGEAWIILKDVIVDIKNNVFPVRIFQSLAEQITGEIGCCEWERFFERVLWGYNKWKIDTVRK